MSARKPQPIDVAMNQANELARRIADRLQLQSHEQVVCPRAKSDTTPCVARDGQLAVSDDLACVGCGLSVGLLLAEERSKTPADDPAPPIAMYMNCRACVESSEPRAQIDVGLGHGKLWVLCVRHGLIESFTPQQIQEQLEQLPACDVEGCGEPHH